MGEALPAGEALSSEYDTRRAFLLLLEYRRAHLP